MHAHNADVLCNKAAAEVPDFGTSLNPRGVKRPAVYCENPAYRNRQLLLLSFHPMLSGSLNLALISAMAWSYRTTRR
jgi:hypothetical protein